MTGRLARYATAATLARLADEMVGVAVVLLVLGRTGSTALAGAVLAGYTFPAMLTGPVVGAWLASARRPRFALLANELLLAAVAAFLVAGVGHVPGWLLVVGTALAGASLPLTSGGFSSLVPRLVPADEAPAEGRPPSAALSRANVVDAVTFNAAAMGGPALAGTLAAVLGPGVAVGAIAAIGGLAAIATTLIQLRPVAVSASSAALLATARAGLRHLATTPPLRAATVTSVLGLGGIGLLAVALPVHMSAIGANRADAGYLWAAIEVGGAASTLLLSHRLRGIPPERVVFGAIGWYGVVLAGWALAGSWWVLLGLAVLAGVVEGPALPALFVARQRYSPAPLLAQVATTGASLKVAGYAVGAALGGWLTTALGAGTVIGLVGAVQIVAVGLGLAVLRSRSVRTDRRPEPRSARPAPPSNDQGSTCR